MNEICDYLEKAFEGSNAPYIKDMCRASRYECVLKINWWIDGMFEILEELINTGYMPQDDVKADYLFQAVGLLEQIDMQR